MQELSLHILDIAQNSVTAGAEHIEIAVTEDLTADLFEIVITDDGRGMDAELLARVTDPFATTRTTRRVGLGIPMFMQAATSCGGSFHIESEPGRGTQVRATFLHSHIDRQPLGDMAGVLSLLISSNPEIAFCYTHVVRCAGGSREFRFDSQQIRQILGEVSVALPEVSQWIREYAAEQEEELGRFVNDNRKDGSI